MRKAKTDGSDNLNLLLFQPTAGWSAPKQFPLLSGVRRIGFDLETRDPLLHSRGPGGIRRDGEVVGMSIATEDAGWYFPYRHLGGGNMDPANVIRFVGDLLKNPGLEVVGANIGYEYEWLAYEGIHPSARFLDVQIAEALLDEERDDGYDLDTLAKNYLGSGKDEALLRDAAKSFNVDPKSGLWKLPAAYVGPYAIFDAYAPLKIFEKQLVRLQDDDLMQIFDIETRLTPILWKMRQQGIPVDLDRAKQSSDKLRAMEDKHRLELRKLLGHDIDIWSGPMLGRMCDEHGIKYPRTVKGNPSFEGDFLEHAESEILQKVAEVRELDRLRSTFIDQWVFKNEINGRIHPVWKQLKSDDGGTRTGRMAAAYPNPQQVPSRSDLAPLIRSIFVPDPGLEWCKIDYSQQEPRLLIHYADLCSLTGANLVRLAYSENPDMDIYQFLADSTKMARKEAKAATLGRMYGMGYRKFGKMYKFTDEVAKKKLEEFDESVPFVKELADKVSGHASRRGYIKTVGGRKRHFNYWEPCDQKGQLPMMRANAEKMWPKSRLQRAHTHKALNSLIQGSAADMTKIAIVQLYENMGVIPYMAVHDETDFGVQDRGTAEKCKTIMEDCVKLTVPVKAEMYVGPNWI